MLEPEFTRREGGMKDDPLDGPGGAWCEVDPERVDAIERKALRQILEGMGERRTPILVYAADRAMGGLWKASIVPTTCAAALIGRRVLAMLLGWAPSFMTE
jgi:hypothetical protein